MTSFIIDEMYLMQVPKGCYLSELHQQLAKVVRSKPASKLPIMEDEAEDPKVSFVNFFDLIHKEVKGNFIIFEL